MEIDLITKHKTFFPMNQGIPSPEIFHIFDQLLGLQLITGITGDILEIGVLQGATIAFLATSLAEKERAFLIDPYQNLNKIKEVIATFAQVNLEQILCFPFDSKIMAKRHAHFLGNYYPLFRFIHIDGEHSYDAVYSDVDLAHKYLGEGGLIVLDDIFSLASPCCTHAMFDYIRDNPNLHCVAMGFNKAYLCESKYVNTYRKFFINLPELLELEANLHIRLCFNSWAYERSYVSFHSVNKDEPKYQVINKMFTSLEELVDYLDLNIQ